MHKNKSGKEGPPENRLNTDAGEALVTGNGSNKVAPVQTANANFQRITYGNLQRNQNLDVHDSARSHGGRMSDDIARPLMTQRDENAAQIISEKSGLSSARDKDLHESKDYSNNPESEKTQKRVLRKVTLCPSEESIGIGRFPPKSPKEDVPMPEVLAEVLLQLEATPDAKFD